MASSWNRSGIGRSSGNRQRQGHGGCGHLAAERASVSGEGKAVSMRVEPPGILSCYQMTVLEWKVETEGPGQVQWRRFEWQCQAMGRGQGGTYREVRAICLVFDSLVSTLRG